MNDIGAFLAVMLAILAAGIIFLMILLTYFETTLGEPLPPRRRIFRKKATTSTDR
jgi:hypothetical protein